MKELIKSKTKKILIIVLIILLPIFIYLLIDGKNLYVDMYNFRQLEKAKPYLEKIDKNTKDFSNLKKFNEIYNVDIQPIKNCYYVDFDNGKYPYIFGFKLESSLLKFLYRTEYYAYPDYSIPVKISGQPIGITNLPDDFNPDFSRRAFERIISNPCEE